MATDTARVQLELASGQNEITAPFHQTAPRRRNREIEPEAVSVGIPSSAQTRVEVPVAASAMSHEQRGRTPWLAFAVAMLSVGFAVWWVMAQRIPDIDPRDVIARNLNDARIAMADGRYTDPPERSAFHYFSTVLAIDPGNADAIAGIDAIADRHLTNARVLLSKGRVAEGGVALEKARRVRPDHHGLAVLDAQWRRELRKLLAAATRIAEPETSPASPVTAAIPKPVALADVESAPLPEVADLTAVAAALAPDQTVTSLQAAALPAPESPPRPESDASIVDELTSVPAAQPTAPKLIKMVQPPYPQDALMRGIEGWVDVSLQVTAAGDVIEPRIEQSNHGRWFNQAALTAVEQWKYEPRSDGITSERLHVRVRFQRSN
ncbi:energy transducer TonB [Steroidobacter cummioxidans]|uniref:energy transducer TonB n=1 Tax=Steroidobacter cummioxidans TaxID=1803913 RepID=UPI00137AB87D|nr:energy transducer TonB [Steroidobacter cummioxidans]